MSALYGEVTGDRGSSTRASHKYIEAWIQTLRGRIKVALTPDGDFHVYLCSSTMGGYKPTLSIARGNVHTQELRLADSPEQFARALVSDDRVKLLCILEAMTQEEAVDATPKR